MPSFVQLLERYSQPDAIRFTFMFRGTHFLFSEVDEQQYFLLRDPSNKLFTLSNHHQGDGIRWAICDYLPDEANPGGIIASAFGEDDVFNLVLAAMELSEGGITRKDLEDWHTDRINSGEYK